MIIKFALDNVYPRFKALLYVICNDIFIANTERQF